MSDLKEDIYHLLRFEHDEPDRQFLERLSIASSMTAYGEEIGKSRHSIARTLKRIRKNAAKFGYRSDDPAASTVMDQPIKGKSRLIKHDPPREDGTVLEWVKTKAEEETLIEAYKQVLEGFAMPAVPPKKFDKEVKGESLPILNLADAHLGILAYEDGKRWGLEDSKELLQKAILKLVTSMQPAKEGLFINHGDLTHTDGMIAQTPKNKNSLDVSDLYFPCVRAATEVVCFAIDLMLTKIQNVTVIMSRGNHDEQTAFHINEALKQRYRLEPRVKILDNDEPHVCYSWKDNFIVATHGDAASNDRAYQYITTRWAKECGDHKYVYVVKGHTHHMVQESIGNMFFETFSTLTKSDAYHEFKMYKSRRTMALVNLHPDGGEDTRITYTPRFGE